MAKREREWTKTVASLVEVYTPAAQVPPSSDEWTYTYSEYDYMITLIFPDRKECVEISTRVPPKFIHGAIVIVADKLLRVYNLSILRTIVIRKLETRVLYKVEEQPNELLNNRKYVVRYMREDPVEVTQNGEDYIYESST